MISLSTKELALLCLVVIPVGLALRPVWWGVTTVVWVGLWAAGERK